MKPLTLPASVVREIRWSRELFSGCSGPEVKRLQEWLCLHDCATAIDSGYGPATTAAVKRFQRKIGARDCDGIAKLVVLEALAHPLVLAFGYPAPAATLRDAVALVAEAHLQHHPREVGGDNRGPWVRAYCGADGAEYRWCAGAALSIARQAAQIVEMTLLIPFTLSCDELAASAAKAHRLTHDPRSVRRGDLFLVRGSRPDDWIHTGIVTAMHTDHFETIEGNTNDEGSPNGYELCARARGFSGKDFVLLG